MMDEKNHPRNKWEDENIMDMEWDLLEEDEERGDKRSKPVFKIGAVIILLAFIAFSYAWLLYLRPPHLDFLKQNRILSDEELVRRCKPAIVNIIATRAKAAENSQGTGFNLESQGLIVTNRHVVEGASSVEITFSEEKRYFSRDIQIIDGYDLALVRLDGEELPFLPVVNDQLPEPEQTVTIIGNPRGFQRVSARGEVEEYYKNETGMLVFTIAAAIAPGSSGSPVLDEEGHLVGIVYATGTININGENQERALAIPASALDFQSRDKL